MWQDNNPQDSYINKCGNFIQNCSNNWSYLNLIFILVIVFFIFLGIFFEFTDHTAMMEIPQSTIDCKTYGCYASSRVYWRVSLIAATISSLLTLYVLHMFNVKISVFMFVLILLLTFLTVYAVFNFLTNHFFDEICNKSG